MTVSIHQPNFLPWLGFFHKLINSDVFVFFDDVQMPRGKSYVSRVKVKYLDSTELWLSIPVSGKSELLPICEVRISEKRIFEKHLKTFTSLYRKAAYFDEVYPGLTEILRTDYDTIADLNIALINWIVKGMNASTKTIRSSRLSNCHGKSGDEKLLCILHELSATTYISGKGAGSKRYIDEDAFAAAGIELIWQEFLHPVYQQLHGPFLENLSIIDLLFNEGFDNARNILLKAGE